MTSSQVLTTDSHLHSPVSPLATDQHCHCLWRTPATIEHTSEKKPLSPLEGCSRPVIETSCLPGPPAEPNQDLPTPTVTDYCSSLASTQMYGEPSLASYNPDTLSLHQTILSTTDGLTSELQAMQLFTPLREVHNYSRYFLAKINKTDYQCMYIMKCDVYECMLITWELMFMQNSCLLFITRYI